MVTLLILVVFGLLFAGFAILGPAERSRSCEHSRIGDPGCEHCPLDGGESSPVGDPDPSKRKPVL